MKKRLLFVFALAMLLIFTLLSMVVAAPGDVPVITAGFSASTSAVQADPVTVITVTSGTDPDDSGAYTCYTDPSGPPGPPTPPCTLRRAIVEASALDPAARPILIRFDIPALAAEGYDPVLNLWKIDLFNTTDTLVLGRLKDGQIIIDGATQPGGRSDGPKIILVGPGTGSKDGMVVGDIAGDDANEIRGLGFQNLRTHLFVNTNGNIIADNWFGLSDDGTEAVLRGDDPENGSGVAGIDALSTADNNLIEHNVFLGFDGTAVTIRGENNTFQNNYVGTRADGTVNKQTDPSLICTTVDWLGGGGVTVQGNGNIIQDNLFAGIRQEIFALSTQPSAIVVAADNMMVARNEIGVDGSQTNVGVCGRGIYLGGSNQPEDNLVISNTIANSALSGISVNGALADGNSLLNNIIVQEGGWIQIVGNPAPENAIQIGPAVPDAHRLFVPAEVTEVDGLTVNGTSGAGSSCPGCLVQVFLDDADMVTETLQFLGETTADGSGNWTLTLPAALGAGEVLRTTSTSDQFNVIPGFSAGTTTRLSRMYGSEEDFQLYLPLMRRP